MILLSLYWARFLTALPKIWAFIMRFWREIAIVGLLWYAHHEKGLYNAKTQELATYQANVADLAKKQAATVAVLQDTAKKSLENVMQDRAVALKQIGGDRDKLKKELQNAYSNHIIRKPAVSVRESTEASADTVSNIANNSSELAKSGGDGDTATAGLGEVEKACAITTQDYNDLREWADIACKTVSCDLR